MGKLIQHLGLVIVLVGFFGSVDAMSERQVRAELQKRLGTSANVRNITPSPIPGLFEVQINQEIFYTDSSAKYLIQGEIIDLA